MKTGQASLEYLVIVSIFLFMLAGAYSLSLDMSGRRIMLQSQIEGERLASLLQKNIQAAAIAGDGFYADVFFGAYPNQTIIVSDADAIILGNNNNSVIIASLAPGMAARSSNAFRSDSTLRINRSGGVVYVQQQ